MSELPPPRVKGQRSATCLTCKAAGRTGHIRYYPRPGVDEDTAAADEAVGNWVHLDRADWVDDPHEPLPDEGEAS